MFVSVGLSVCLQNKKNRRHAASYREARLYLTASLDFYQNSIPFFEALAFCTMEINDSKKNPVQ